MPPTVERNKRHDMKLPKNASSLCKYCRPLFVHMISLLLEKRFFVAWVEYATACSRRVAIEQAAVDAKVEEASRASAVSGAAALEEASEPPASAAEVHYG